MRTVYATGFMAFGLSLIAFAFAAARNLYRMLEDEGTESFSAAYGPGGTLGCVSFLMLLAFGGTLLVCYGIHVVQTQLR